MSRRLLMPLITAFLLAAPLIALKVDRLRTLLTPDHATETRVLDLLDRNGFDTQRDKTTDNGALIRARRGACSLELREVSALGWDRSTIKKVAGARSVVYIYNGNVYRDQPVWRTWAYFHLRRLALFLGGSLTKRTTFAAISSDSCQGLQWRDLTAGAKAAVFGADTSAA